MGGIVGMALATQCSAYACEESGRIRGVGKTGYRILGPQMPELLAAAKTPVYLGLNEQS